MLLFIGASPRGGLGANALCLSCDKPPKEQSAAIILVSKLPDMIALDYQYCRDRRPRRSVWDNPQSVVCIDDEYTTENINVYIII